MPSRLTGVAIGIRQQRVEAQTVAGWQSSAAQIAASVAKRRPRALPV